jgi:GTP-binding protein
MAEPIVAIVGRPNVGKSTLFNRLVKQRKTIVHARAGITRDRVYEKVHWSGRSFLLVDTGGFVPPSADQIENAIRSQVIYAISEADLLLLLLDAKSELSSIEFEIATLIRRANKQVIVIANKCDNERLEMQSLALCELGLGEVFPISALNGRNIGDLLDLILTKIPVKVALPASDLQHLCLAIVGLPNAGKSSILNALVGSEKAIVTDIPGTTRDSIDSEIQYYGKPVTLIDTAGIRKKSNIVDEVEFYSILRAFRAIERANVVLLVVDAEKGFTRQDAKLVRHVIDNKKGLVVAINKWDLVPKTTQTAHEFRQAIITEYGDLEFYPFLFISAKTKQRIHTILQTALQVYQNRQRRISTSELNAVFQRIIEQSPPPAVQGAFIKIKYVTQVKIDPPVVVFFCNEPYLIKSEYRRFLERQLHAHFDFFGVPVTITFRKK